MTDIFKNIIDAKTSNDMSSNGVRVKPSKPTFLQNDVLTGLLKEVTEERENAGKDMYGLIISAEDVLYCPDMIVLSLINRNYLNLPVDVHEELIDETVTILRNGVDCSVIDIRKISISDIDISDRYKAASHQHRYSTGLFSIELFPLTKNENSIESYYISAKKKPGFILRELYNEYFNDLPQISKSNYAALHYRSFVNPNSPSILSMETNYLMYDDSIPFAHSILNGHINYFHNSRLIKKIDLIATIIEWVTDRRCIIDFVTDNIEWLITHIYDELYTLWKDGVLSDEVINNFNTAGLTGMNSVGNLQYLNHIMEDPRSRRKLKCSIGLMNLFKAGITTNSIKSRQQ